MRVTNSKVIEGISLSKLSTLLTARITGFLERRNISATLASESTSPCLTSVRNIITSAVSIAISACSLICARITSLVSGSIPPVSIKVNDLSSHVTSAYILSLVTPGVSFTIEICCPARSLNNVDLPTLGRPTTATIGLLIYLPPI
jgi:hypothetical protein